MKKNTKVTINKRRNIKNIERQYIKEDINVQNTS